VSTVTRPFERVLDHFLLALRAANCRYSLDADGERGMAQCPAHDDRSPSLSIGIGERGQLIFHCFAGCPRDQVLQALQLDWTALFPGELKATSKSKSKSHRASAAAKGNGSKTLSWFDELQRSGELFTAAELLERVTAFVRRFVVMGAAEVDALALWILHTWTIEAADTTPYLEVSSAEKSSGKTRLLEALELLVARPWFTGSISTAVLARKVDAEQSTLLLDESDAAFKGDKEYAEALRGVLNTGYRRGGQYSRMVGQGSAQQPQDFSTFGAKAIAGIGHLPDTIADRSIAIRLKKRRPDEPVAPFRRRDVETETKPLRELLEGWAWCVVEELRAARPDLPEELGDRAGDCWEPLLAIADLAAGHWPDAARSAAVTLSGRSEQSESDSIGVQLLADVRHAFGSRDRIPTAELLEHLHGLEESPWGDWYGKPVTTQRLAKLLKQYEIRSRSIWIADGMTQGKTAKGYLRDQFEDTWARYLPSQNGRSAEPASEVGSGGFSDPACDHHLTGREQAAIPHGEPVLPGLTALEPGAGADGVLEEVSDEEWNEATARGALVVRLEVEGSGG
jgi:hypothetical protein